MTENKSLEVRYAPITGYKYKYRISTLGIVEKKYSNGEWRPISVWLSNTHHYACCHMRSLDNKRSPIRVVDLMAEAFMGGRKAHKGMSIGHRNGSVMDNELVNLYWATPSEIGKRYSGMNRKPVQKIDRNGEIVEVFSSLTECAKHEHVSRKALWHRLNKNIKGDQFALTGYTYKYER